MATFAAGLRTPFARYWLSGFLADFGDGIRLPAFPLLAAVIAAALLTGCGGTSANQVSATRTEPSSSRSAARVTTPPPSRPTGPPTAPPSRPVGPPTAEPVAPGAGALPQTRARPSTDSPAFRAAMQDL